MKSCHLDTRIMGQYVTTKDGRTLYKADSGKYYKNYLDATLAMDSTPQEDVQRLGRATGRALSGIGSNVTDYLYKFGRANEPSSATTTTTTNLSPLERAEVGQPLVLGGRLGYKAADGTWQPRGEMDAPVPGVTGDAVYDGQKYSYLDPIAPTPALVTGLDSTGAVDRRQSDEYKSIRAQYDQARKELPAAEARDKGLELWAQANPELAARLQKPTSNPLMERTFGYQTGQGPGQITMAPDQETVQGDLGSRAQGEGGYNYEALMAERARRQQSPSPLVQQEMQQQATADQAAQATTAGMSTADKADELVKRFKTPAGAFPLQKLF
jgi:hypothetical protein